MRERLLVVDDDPGLLLAVSDTLREEGYDAVGARSVEEALVYRPEIAERGPVGLVLVDADVVGKGELAALLTRHGNPPAAVLAHAGQKVPPGGWVRVIRRPTSIAELARVVQELVPLPGQSRGPLDR